MSAYNCATIAEQYARAHGAPARTQAVAIHRGSHWLFQTAFELRWAARAARWCHAPQKCQDFCTIATLRARGLTAHAAHTHTLKRELAPQTMGGF